MKADGRPLEGVQILDVSRVLAGPFCTMILADLGARVIKVEPPEGGDETRAWGPPFLGEQSAYFNSINRNKLSLTLNLKSEAGRNILYQLATGSDAIVENFTPETAQKLGVTEELLKQHNPKIIHCSVSGFGRDSQAANTPGYDFIIQALSGLMSITGEANGTPMKVGVALTDVITGLFAAIGVLASLRDGKKQPNHIGVGLFQAAMASLVNVVQGHLVTGDVPQRYGNQHPNIVPYQAFAASDGYIVVAVGNDRQFSKLCQVLGHAGLAKDPRFATNPERVRNRQTLLPILEATFAKESKGKWCDALDAAAIPNGAVQDVKEAVALLAKIEPSALLRSKSGQTFIASPIRVNHEKPTTPQEPAKLGEHTDEILRELGLTPAAIGKLRADGIC